MKVSLTEKQADIVSSALYPLRGDNPEAFAAYVNGEFRGYWGVNPAHPQCREIRGYLSKKSEASN
jgi:hypothetical protein